MRFTDQETQRVSLRWTIKSILAHTCRTSCLLTLFYFHFPLICYFVLICKKYINLMDAHSCHKLHPRHDTVMILTSFSSVACKFLNSEDILCVI